MTCRQITGNQSRMSTAGGSLPMLVNGFYLLVIVLSLAYCGGLALYYYTRRRHVEAFVRETPDWVRRQLLELDR